MGVKRMVSFVMPGGILFLASVLIVHSGMFSRWTAVLTHIYPCVVLFCAVLMGLRFNRSSLVFASVILAASDRSLMYSAGQGTVGESVFAAVSVLLPLNMALLCMMKERGIVTVHGIFRVGLILLQGCITAVFIRVNPAGVHAFFDYSLVHKDVVKFIMLSQPALVAFGIAFVVVGVGFWMHGGAKESGFFWALVTSLTCLMTSPSSEERVFYFASAGLVLLISIIEASHAMAFRDELTGLPARRALREDLLKLGNRYALAMLDIDHFKKFNDRHGHDAGDQVLRMVASRLSKVSGGGRAYRYGGEEFTVIFAGRNADNAALHLEELRKVVASSGFVLRSWSRPMRKPKKPKKFKNSQKKVSVTVSIGLAGSGGNNVNPQDVLKAADRALYRAKKSGRNRLAA